MTDPYGGSRPECPDGRVVAAYDRLIAAMRAGQPDVILEALRDRCVRAEQSAIRHGDSLARLWAATPPRTAGMT